MKDSMIRRFQRVVTVLAPVALLLTSQPLSAHNQGQDCSNLVINHSFAGVFEGFLNVPVYLVSLGMTPPPGVGIVPNAGLEFITFLPQGRVKGQVTIVAGLMGVFKDQPFESAKDGSTYSLSWDTAKPAASCSGTLTVNVPGLPSNFQLLVTQDGQRTEQIHTDAGLIVGVTGYRVETSGCGNNSLNGKYPYNIKGWALNYPPFSFSMDQLLSGYFPFAFSGVMEFQPRSSTPGSGSVEGWDTLSANGTIIPRSYTGSYQVNRDCTGTMVLKDATSQFNLELFVDKSGGAVHMVNVDTIPSSPVPLFVLGATLNPANGN